MKREERATQATCLTECNERYWKDEIEESIAGSRFYGEGLIRPSGREGIIGTPKIVVSMYDTVMAIVAELSENYAALNFASFRHPGGGFINGAFAQEEALCHESYLYNVLSAFPNFYDWNEKQLNNSLYRNRAIVSKIRFFKNMGMFIDSTVCQVITCAAPNKKAAQRNHGATDEEVSKVLRERISFIMDIVNDINVDTFITGAFGCGAFGNDPKEVAELFVEEAKKTKLKNLVFAVPPGNQNYEIISETVERLTK